MRFLLLFLLAGCAGDEPAKAAKIRAPGEHWIVMGTEKQISDTEDVRVMRVASSVAPKMRQLDRVCLLYRNHEFKTTNIVCPDGVPDLSLYGD